MYVEQLTYPLLSTFGPLVRQIINVLLFELFLISPSIIKSRKPPDCTNCIIWTLLVFLTSSPTLLPLDHWPFVSSTLPFAAHLPLSDQLLPGPSDLNLNVISS